MLSLQLFHEYEQFRWSLADIPWSRIARENVKPEYVGFTRAAVMVERNSVAALHGFLNESLDDYDFATYASLWSSQELLHHFAFRTYLEQLGHTHPGRGDRGDPRSLSARSHARRDAGHEHHLRAHGLPRVPGDGSLGGGARPQGDSFHAQVRTRPGTLAHSSTTLVAVSIDIPMSSSPRWRFLRRVHRGSPREHQTPRERLQGQACRVP